MTPAPETAAVTPAESLLRRLLVRQPNGSWWFVDHLNGQPVPLPAWLWKACEDAVPRPPPGSPPR